MSPVILVIVCTSCEKIMPCGCAAALKGMAAWKGSIFGLYREAARNKTRTRSKSCKFHFRSQPYCNRVFRWIYWVFEENLPKRRFVALLLPSGSDVLAGFMRSPESAHFSWRQEAKADVCGCSAALKKIKNHILFIQRRDCVGFISWPSQRMLYEQFLSAAAALRATAARLMLDYWTIYWLSPNRHMRIMQNTALTLRHASTTL